VQYLVNNCIINSAEYTLGHVIYSGLLATFLRDLAPASALASSFSCSGLRAILSTSPSANSSSHVLFSLGDSNNTFHLLSIGSDNATLLLNTGIFSSIDGSGILFLFFLASSDVISLFFLCSLGRILCPAQHARSWRSRSVSCTSLKMDACSCRCR
jgi:hypothetical protein